MNLKNELKNIYKNVNLIQEALKDKSQAFSNERNNYQNKIILLNQEIQKKYNELILWGKAEKNKLWVQHQQNMKRIGIQ
jgi:predicted Zn-dependent protease